MGSGLDLFFASSERVDLAEGAPGNAAQVTKESLPYLHAHVQYSDRAQHETRRSYSIHDNPDTSHPTDPTVPPLQYGVSHKYNVYHAQSSGL